MAKQSKKPAAIYDPPYPFVEVIWDDATVATDPWTHRDDLPGLEQVCTRGFLVKTTRKLLTIAASVTNVGGQEGEDHFAGIISIPTGMIVERRDLQVTRVMQTKRRHSSLKLATEDAMARAEGMNLDGSERRETIVAEEDLGRSIVNQGRKS